MKYAIYARVSTEDQHLEHQIEPCIKRCGAEGWDYEVYSEKVSGAKDTRPILNEMLTDVRARKVHGIMVYKLDRLGRSLKHLLNITEELNKKGIPFISISESFDTNTPMGRFTLYIMGALAQMEREMISERTKARLDYLRKHGKKLGRPKGSKDKKPRRKSGYHQRWAGGKRANPWGKNGE